MNGKKITLRLWELLIVSVLLILVICGCSNKTSEMYTRPQDSDNDVITPSTESTNNFDNRKATTRHRGLPSWVLEVDHSEAFTGSLVNFFILNNRYPRSVEELIDSKLLYIWPADPRTGKAMKLVSSLSPVSDDQGKISYVYKSDTEAYFQFIVYREHLDELVTINLPTVGIKDKLKTRYERKDKANMSIPAATFHPMMNKLFGATVQKDEYITGKEVPISVGETVKNNFFWIKENMLPDFLSNQEEEAVFYEWGIAELESQPVAFFQFSLPRTAHDGSSRVSKYKNMLTLKDSKTLPIKDWDLMTNKKFIYSSEKLLAGTLDLPDEILISKDEILGN